MNIKIIKRNQAKYLHLKIDLFGINAIVPSDYEHEELKFIEDNKDWISKKSHYYEKLAYQYGGEENLRTDKIFFLGKKYDVQLVKDRMSFAVISENLKLITFHMADKRKYKDDIKKWYATQTEKTIAERLPLHSTRLNLHYNKVSIKNQMSRWGSCSPKKNLSFNLLLAGAPLPVIDYVVIHELVHLLVPSHSREFWNHVRAADLEYEKHKQWLQINGPLMKFGLTRRP